MTEMKNNKRKMNIFLSTTLWIVLVPIILGLILFLLSGFDGMVIMLMCFGFIHIVPILLFGATSFILGYYGLHSWWIPISILVVSGLLTLFLAAFCVRLSPDPALLFGTLKLLLLFVIAFMSGYIGRNLSQSGFIIDTVVVGALFLYLALGQVALGAFAPFSYNYFWTCDISSQWYSEQENGTSYYKNPKMFIDPFPAQIIGVKYYNDRGEFVGYSNDINYSYSAIGISDGEMTSDNSDILLHKNYEENLRTILASSSNAIRKDLPQHSVLTHYESDTLFRKEVFYHPNGVVSWVRCYYFNHKFETFVVYKETFFDPLGYVEPQKWSIRDFRKSNGVPQIVHSVGVSTDSLNGRKLDESQTRIVENIHIIDTLRNTLKNKNKRCDNIEILLESVQFDPTNKASICINPRGYMRKGYFDWPDDFTQLKSVEQMGTILDALALCRLESGIGEVHSDCEDCTEIRINEIGTDNYIYLYLLNDRAISADFRFSFIYNPMIHTDPKKQADAKRLWDEMKDIVKF